MTPAATSRRPTSKPDERGFMQRRRLAGRRYFIIVPPMPVVAGSHLGPYEIVAPLGAGGMGEVWRARDTRLDRSVAIKVLPAEFSADPHLKERLQREAKAISQLNHPHICSLYD